MLCLHLSPLPSVVYTHTHTHDGKLEIPQAAQFSNLRKHNVSVHTLSTATFAKGVNDVTVSVSPTCCSEIPNSKVARCQPEDQYLPDCMRVTQGASCTSTNKPTKSFRLHLQRVLHIKSTGGVGVCILNHFSRSFLCISTFGNNILMGVMWERKPSHFCRLICKCIQKSITCFRRNFKIFSYAGPNHLHLETTKSN